MTTFAPNRDTVESFVDCINGGADKDTLTRLLAENVVLYGPFGDEPITGREVAVETIKSVNELSCDDTYLEVLSGDTHHAAHFRLQIGDAAVNGPRNKLMDGNIANWPRVLAKVEALHPVSVLPGHGDAGGPEILSGQSQFLVDLYSEVKQQAAAGKTPSTILRLPF